MRQVASRVRSVWPLAMWNTAEGQYPSNTVSHQVNLLGNPHKFIEMYSYAIVWMSITLLHNLEARGGSATAIQCYCSFRTGPTSSQTREASGLWLKSASGACLQNLGAIWLL